MIQSETPIHIRVVYDNVAYESGYTADWGFSCYVEGLEKSILFDTGGDGTILLSNLKGLGISPQDVNVLFLSHIHGDHVGGVEPFLSQNSEVDVYIPQSFPADFRKSVEAAGARYREAGAAIAICENAYSTGELGNGIKEQSLVIKTAKGLVVITGCAHPGIVEIAKTAKRLFNEDISLVLGGFHLFHKSDDEMRNIVDEFRNLGVRKVGPCHCTGSRAQELLELEYGDDFIKLGVGARIDLE